MANYLNGRLEAERPTSPDDDFVIDPEMDSNYEGFAGTYRSFVPVEGKPKLSASIRLSVNDPRYFSIYSARRRQETTRQIIESEAA